MFKFIFGALVGATVALLMTPKSGQELREDISNQVNDSIEQGKATAHRASRRAREISDQAQRYVRQTAAGDQEESTESAT